MRRGLLAGVALVALMIGGCASAPIASPSGASPDDMGIAPVLTRDFPDPDVLQIGDEYYAYATNANLRNVQVAVSTDLESWQRLPDDGMPALPSWVVPGKTWAPEVWTFEPGIVTMYATATDAASGRQCIFRATASDPEGPFVAADDAMLICPVDEGGAIDAAVAIVGGEPYLLWKNDGNCCGLDTWLYASPLSPDGAAIIGERVPLVQQTLAWEGDLVEAPTLIERDGTLHLFYSANSYGGDAYATGLATAPALTGPWTKQHTPFASTASLDGAIRGPGGQDIVIAPDGRTVMIVHGWNRSYTARELYLLDLDWKNGAAPVVLPPG